MTQLTTWLKPIDPTYCFGIRVSSLETHIKNTTVWKKKEASNRSHEILFETILIFETGFHETRETKKLGFKNHEIKFDFSRRDSHFVAEIDIINSKQN